MRLTVRSTSTRTFVAWPLVILGERLVRRRVPSRAQLAAGAPLLAAGWLTYRTCGRYRMTRGGGPAGMSQGMPDSIVTTGPYALSRNPMYAGHVVFFTGLTIASGSPVAAAALLGHLPWFNARARRDEERLRARFGASYDAYAARVPRWVRIRQPRIIARPTRPLV